MTSQDEINPLELPTDSLDNDSEDSHDILEEIDPPYDETEAYQLKEKPLISSSSTAQELNFGPTTSSYSGDNV
ncbi:hypothetical protein AVEN_41764-1, partial [Araneus ventricosus]